MAYTKNKWAIFNPELPDEQQPDAFITKAKLENIEKGIEEAHNLAEGTGFSIGEVTSGTDASAEIVDGKLNLVLPIGPVGPAGDKGEAGDTPVLGVDYFTEDDKTAIVDSVLAAKKHEPYYDEALNKFFACGVHINVYAADEPGKLKITWLTTGANDGESAIVPENIDIFGGCASEDKVFYYPATSIAVYGGNIDSVMMGCFGNGSVGNATLIVNGGKLNYACGGGMHWAEKNAHNNIVGNANIILNDAEKIEYVCGGTGSGVCTTGATNIVVNGGNYGVVMAGGTNGYTGKGEITVNGGTIRSVQAGNRGTLGNIKITVNDGTITNAVYSGVGDTATFIKSELHILGGTINKVSPGKYAGTEDTLAERVSGTYVNGVINDTQASALHLTKVPTINELLQRIIDLELANA